MTISTPSFWNAGDEVIFGTHACRSFRDGPGKMRGIVRVRCETEPHACVVFLLGAAEERSQAGSAPDDEREDPSGERIECARVADAGGAERPPHARDDVVRGGARRLVDDEDAANISFQLSVLSYQFQLTGVSSQ